MSCYVIESMFTNALSNHGDLSEWDSYEPDLQYESEPYTKDPLYYFTDVTDTVEILEQGDRFTVIQELRGNKLKLSIPNKIFKKVNNKLFVHTKIYNSISKKKIEWLEENTQWKRLI